MSAHTPGPWATVTLGHQQNRQTQIRDEAGEIVIAVLPTRSHTEANARLIAAAPDLLEAVQGVDLLYAEMQAALPALANTPAMDRITAAVRLARAAIAKAVST